MSTSKSQEKSKSGSGPTTQRPVSWLLFDMSNLAWRAHHTTGHLSHNGKPTGVIYGVLRDIRSMTTRGWPRANPVFCFDHGKPHRVNYYKDYKANREMTPERKTVRRQIRELRDEVLPALGYVNIFSQDGFEADDVIASVSKSLEGHLGHRVYVVSGDHDLFQLLGVNVFQYMPAQKRIMQASDLYKEYGVHPHQWAWVKAIVGCKTDNVKGIDGVGEKTAAAYLNKTLKSQKVLDKIDKRQERVNRNLLLVKLPFTGCPQFDPREETADQDKWNRVLRKYGIKSLGV